MLTWRDRLQPGSGSSEAWLRRGFRTLFALTLGVLLLLGIRDVLRPFVAGSPSGPAATGTPAGFPTEAAEALAVRCAMAYLTYDSAHPDVRRRALQAYLDDGGDPTFGWDGRGRQAAVAGVPTGVAARDSEHAIVTVAVLVDGQRWVNVAVPVIDDGGRLGVGAAPVLMPAPAVARSTADVQVVDRDPVLSAQLQPYLSAFLRAYGQSNQAELAYYAAPGAGLAGLGDQVTFAALVYVSLEQKAGETRSAVVSVRWQDRASGAGLTQQYRLQLVHADGKWLVREMSPDV